MDLHVFPILIPPPTSLSTGSLWVLPVLIYASNHGVSYSPVLQIRKVRHRKITEIESQPS